MTCFSPGAVARELQQQAAPRPHEALQVFQEADHNLQGSWCGLSKLTWYAALGNPGACSGEAQCSQHGGAL